MSTNTSTTTTAPLKSKKGGSGGKKKKRKQHKRAETRKSRGGNAHQRKLSSAHHQTVVSLVSLATTTNSLQHLAKASTDYKMQRELQRALIELQQRDQDFQSAVEIGDHLSQENQALHEDLEMFRNSSHALQSENDLLREKLETVQNSYELEMQRLEGDLEEKDEMCQAYQTDLMMKDKTIREMDGDLQKQLGIQLNAKSTAGHSSADSGGGNSRHQRRDSMDSNFTAIESADLQSKREKKLHQKWSEERKKVTEFQKRLEELLKENDALRTSQMEFEQIKHNYEMEKERRQAAEQETDEQHKAMENQVIFLSSQSSTLEQERDELQKLLDQRDYEIQMMNSAIQSGHRPNQQTLAQEDLQSTLFSDFQTNALLEEVEMSPGEEDEDDMEDDESDSLNDVDFNDLAGDLQDPPTAPESGEAEEKPKKAAPAVFVPDVIKEYLHLTASAVKIKFPRVSSISSQQMIDKVRHLPFYKYHDYMVKICETEKAAAAAEAKAAAEAAAAAASGKDKTSLATGDPPHPAQLTRKNSFMSRFGFSWFGSNDDEKGNDNRGNKEGTTDKPSNVGHIEASKNKTGGADDNLDEILGTIDMDGIDFEDDDNSGNTDKQKQHSSGSTQITSHKKRKSDGDYRKKSNKGVVAGASAKQRKSRNILHNKSQNYRKP